MSPPALERVDSVEAVVVGGGVGHPVAEQDVVIGAIRLRRIERAVLFVGTVEEDAVLLVPPNREVLDGDAARLDREPVGQPIAAVEYHRVSIDTVDHDARGLDVDCLLIGTGADQHEVSRAGGVDSGLDRAVLVGHDSNRHAVVAVFAARHERAGHEHE